MTFEKIRKLQLALIFFTFSLVPLIGHSKDTAIPVSNGVQYELIGHWKKEKLNQILKKDFPSFSGVAVQYSEAQNGVLLYRVTYQSEIPERANKSITATGLVAVPDNIPAGRATSLPMLSYQHGTVYGKNEVPSAPDNSPETQLMLAQFGGQGYVVIGADYFGMGNSSELDGYMVKASHQQATYDMLLASRAVLQHQKISTNDLFIAGWSQGGFVTMAFLERLEKEGVKVRAAATASAPPDIFALLNGFLFYPRAIDAEWINLVVIFSAFSFENYYASSGLTRSLFKEEYYENARKAYLREKVNVADIPSDLHKLLRAENFDPVFFADSPYGRLASNTTVYRWIYQTPVRNYYGEKDEVIPINSGKLIMTYQQGVGAGNPNVTAISTGPTTHRGTYAMAVPEWKTWFDAQRKK